MQSVEPLVGIPREALELIGVERTRTCEVSDREIRRFCQATGVGEPEVSADGRLVAPPLFCQVYMFEDVPVEALPADGSPKELDVPLPASRAVGGGSDFEVFRRVRSGDVVTVRTRLKDVSARQGKSGTLYLVVVETSFHDGAGEALARETATYVRRL